MKTLTMAVAGLLALCGCTTKTEPAREPMRVTLTFDDSLKDHLLIAAPQLEARGWRGTFNLVTDWVGTKPEMMTWADARELVQRGHELTTHSKTHPVMVKLDEAAVRGELSASRDAIAENTGFAPRFYCPPFGQWNEGTARLARLEGLEEMRASRYNFGQGSGTSVRKLLEREYAAGTKRLDILHHGVCSVEGGGRGGWSPFESEAAFAAHLDVIAEFEREGKIIVTDYDGMVSNCKLKAKAWPRHGVVALSFDDLNIGDWETAFPLFAKYGARTTFFMVSALDAKAIAFAHKAMLAGHEVGLHGVAHRNADQYAAAKGLAGYWRDEIEPQLAACRAAGIRPRSFAYPNCRRTPETDELFRTNGFTRVRGLSDGVPCPTPHDPKNEKAAQRHPVAESDSEFFPAADYLKIHRIRNVIMGDFYHTDIEDYVRVMRRAGERGEAISVVSHGISPNANGISMKTAWLERMLSEADEAGVIVRGAR